jgi:hypothetical protein
MQGGIKYFGALHLFLFQSVFFYKYSAALPLPAGNVGYGKK